MRLNRREFIAAGIVGTTLGCRSRDTSRSDSRPIRLEVQFSGLCGFVHRRALRLSDVLLIDAAATQTLKTVPHSPRLITAAANFQSGQTPTIENGQAFWDLTGFKVTLPSESTTGPTETTGLRRPGEEQVPNEDKASHPDVTWLSQMARIPGTGQGKIDPVNLADNPRPPKVASRMRFTGGQFAARFRPPYDQVRWRIGTGTPPPVEQAIGEPMVTQNVNAQSVTFLLEEYGSSTSSQIVLAPPQGADRTLIVEVRNMPTNHEKCVDPAAQILAHFATYYELLATQPAQPWEVPHCTSNCHDCGGAMEEPVYCHGTGYEP